MAAYQRGMSYPNEEMRETLAHLLEWEANTGGYESAVWKQAHTLMNDIRNWEDEYAAIHDPRSRAALPDGEED